MSSDRLAITLRLLREAEKVVYVVADSQCQCSSEEEMVACNRCHARNIELSLNKEIADLQAMIDQAETKGFTQQFKFSLGGRVLIKEIQRPGSVDSVTIDYLGIQYRVAYWDNSERKTVWLKEEELEGM